LGCRVRERRAGQTKAEGGVIRGGRGGGGQVAAAVGCQAAWHWMDPFAAALDAASNAARGAKRPRHNDPPDRHSQAGQQQHRQQPPFIAPGGGMQGQQWSNQSQAGAARYGTYQPPMHPGGYGGPPLSGQPYGQQASHGQPYDQGSHQLSMQQPYVGPAALQPGASWGRPAVPTHPASHPAYSGHPGPPGPPGPVAYPPPQPAHSVHSYGARMAYGSGPPEDARRQPSHHAQGRSDSRTRDSADEACGPRKHNVPCVLSVSVC